MALLATESVSIALSGLLLPPEVGVNRHSHLIFGGQEQHIQFFLPMEEWENKQLLSINDCLIYDRPKKTTSLFNGNGMVEVLDSSMMSKCNNKQSIVEKP